MKKKRERKVKICEACGEEFHPYNGRQRVCSKDECRLWLIKHTSYKKRRYITPKGEVVTLDKLTPIDE